MTVEEFDRLTPFQREQLEELRKLRMALEGVLKIWAKMADMDSL